MVTVIGTTLVFSGDLFWIFKTENLRVDYRFKAIQLELVISSYVR